MLTCDISEYCIYADECGHERMLTCPVRRRYEEDPQHWLKKYREMKEENIKCEICGCTGNMSCGHELKAKDCSLNESLICACCEFEECWKHIMESRISGI